MQNALLIALTAEGTIALGQIARLATLVIDDGRRGLCRIRIQDESAGWMRSGPVDCRLAALVRGEPRHTRYGLQDNDARQQNRQPSLSVIETRKIHRLDANDLQRMTGGESSTMLADAFVSDPGGPARRAARRRGS